LCQAPPSAATTTADVVTSTNATGKSTVVVVGYDRLRRIVEEGGAADSRVGRLAKGDDVVLRGQFFVVEKIVGRLVGSVIHGGEPYGG
jgi:hypothetical protein